MHTQWAAGKTKNPKQNIMSLSLIHTLVFPVEKWITITIRLDDLAKINVFS